MGETEPKQPESNGLTRKQRGAARDKPEGRKSEKPPRFRLVKKQGRSVGVQPDESEEPFRGKLAEATGTADFDLGMKLLNQAVNTFLPNELSAPVDCLNLSAALLHSIKPEDPIEGMLAVQMMGTHNLAMEFLRRAGAKEQTLEGFCQNVNGATKLLRTFAAQMEALSRYRTKGQQRVVVEHVNVSAGGQAIVGLVEAKSGGRGGNEKT